MKTPSPFASKGQRRRQPSAALLRANLKRMVAILRQQRQPFYPLDMARTPASQRTITPPPPMKSASAPTSRRGAVCMTLIGRSTS